MKLTIRSHAPAWDAEYGVYLDNREAYRVRLSRDGNFHHIRIFDMAEHEAGHVYQNDTGITGECMGRQLLTVERRMGLRYQMIPVVESWQFRGCSLFRGDIQKRDYVLYANRHPITVYPPTYGIAVEFPDHLAQPLEILILVLAIEAIAQYT